MYYHRARHPGITRMSLRSVHRHLSKIGTPLWAEAYSMNVKTRNGDSSRCYVVVTGTTGKIRFGGFSWGYHGEGPRGLQALLGSLGYKGDPPQTWPDFKGTNAATTKLNQKAYHWNINFEDPEPHLSWEERSQDWE
jgi:hypothetical protein